MQRLRQLAPLAQVRMPAGRHVQSSSRGSEPFPWDPPRVPPGPSLRLGPVSDALCSGPCSIPHSGLQLTIVL